MLVCVSPALAGSTLLGARLAFRCAMSAAARKRKRMDVEIHSVKLTAVEQKIFEKLLAAERHFGLGTQLRVAGGWVRDKLLGKDCYDIDIALDNMLGLDFCEKVNEYLKSVGEDVSNVGVIASNPDQSKHLETATMRVEGVWLDFVNLRAETYADDSRIPTAMEFGTPKQDAERRDLTINSLFYNINSGQIEDYTERGIRDLKAGVIATPLDPHVTFLDDPLRVLRSVRFSSRFGFELDENLKMAASSDEVRDALGRKISRERVGHEVELMLLGSEPTDAIELLFELKLFPVVFTPPSKLEDTWDRICVQHIQAALDVLQSSNTQLLGEQRLIFLLAALLFSLDGSTYEDKKRKKHPTTSFIIRESLKLKNAHADGVLKLHRSAREFKRLTDVLLTEGDANSAGHKAATTWEEVRRIETGVELMEIKEMWRAALVLSSLVDLFTSSAWQAQEKANLCNAVVESITNKGLEGVWEAKPLLNGNEIMEELKLKGGPAVKHWKSLATQWQLAHPKGTAEEVRHWVKSQHSMES